MTYAYMRVSTVEQRLDRQEAALKDYCARQGIDLAAVKIFADKSTGKRFDRAEYQALKAALKPGDTLLIKELDRLGRTWDGIAEEWRELTARGVWMVVIDMPLLSDTSHDADANAARLIRRVVFEVLCYRAQAEAEKISQRTREGLAAARARGKRIGARSKNPDGVPVELIRTLAASGCTYSEIMTAANVSRGTVAKVIKEALK
jgi:DNA invertase Pin-like site-specific DNA recombinase